MYLPLPGLVAFTFFGLGSLIRVNYKTLFVIRNEISFCIKQMPTCNDASEDLCGVVIYKSRRRFQNGS